jgi:hypothetical protein
VDGFRGSTFGVDHAFRLCGPLGVNVEEGNFGALAGEEDGCGAAIADFTCKRRM